MAESTQPTTPPIDTPETKPSDAPIAIFKKRGLKKSVNLRKRPATPPPDSPGTDTSDYASDHNENSDRNIKRRRKGGIDASVASRQHDRTSNLAADTHAADTAASIQAVDEATKVSNIELLGREQHKPTKNGPGAPTAAARQVGPVKSASNIRAITMIDLAPDVCKDYKQTGFCGFGDNCKYLHAREDYKAGWELDRDWEINTKGKKIAGKVVSSINNRGAAAAEEKTEDEKLKDIPFACFICKGPYKHPIVTRCGHYFCEKCALGRYKKTPACAACGSGTSGVFNSAKDLQRLLDRKRVGEEEEGVEDVEDD